MRTLVGGKEKFTLDSTVVGEEIREADVKGHGQINHEQLEKGYPL